jgi:hypothetical protein
MGGDERYQLQRGVKRAARGLSGSRGNGFPLSEGVEPVEMDAEGGAVLAGWFLRAVLAGRDEEVADGTEDGKEALQGSRRSEMLQDPFSLS